MAATISSEIAKGTVEYRIFFYLVPKFQKPGMPIKYHYVD